MIHLTKNLAQLGSSHLNLNGVEVEFHGTPDTLTLPARMGGMELRVVAPIKDTQCPECGEKHSGYMCAGGIFMLECPTTGYLWCVIKNNQS